MDGSHTRFELRAFAGVLSAIDAAAGVIRGVSVISVGDAKGHGIKIDQTTLEQVKACAETYSNGLKVKMSHAGDAGDIVGFLSAFRIDGDKLLADLTLLKSSRFREYVLELASTIPDTFGLSISFSGPVEMKGETRFARCAEIYSADLVSEPAANPSGLFEAKPASASGDKPEHNQPKTTMDETKLAALQTALDSLSARLEKIEKATPAQPAAPAPAVDISQVAELAAKNAFKLFSAQFGTPPAAPSNEPKAPTSPADKSFETLVREHPKYSENKTVAIGDTVAKHPKAHADYLRRVDGGEVILF